MDTDAFAAYKSIVVLTGAGVSTNCGIPDYRSKGLFEQIKSYFPDAVSPEDVFSRSFNSDHDVFNSPPYISFKSKVMAAEPGLVHRMCVTLHQQGRLCRVYTQNVDGLHQKAGLPEDKVVEFHGSLLKGTVVLYEDPIPERALNQVAVDFATKDSVDLVLVMGTSLQVAPFCAIPNLASRTCKRVLVTKNVEQALSNVWNELPGCQAVKFGKLKVTCRSEWADNNRFKNQVLFDMDVDDWCNKPTFE